MPGEAVARVVLEIFFQIVCYFIAKVLLPILTFGRVYAESWDRRHRIRFRWHGVHRQPNGKIILNADLAALIGMLMLAAVIAIGVLSYFTFGR